MLNFYFYKFDLQLCQLCGLGWNTCDLIVGTFSRALRKELELGKTSQGKAQGALTLARGKRNIFSLR